jgi:hypothetical protein
MSSYLAICRESFEGRVSQKRYVRFHIHWAVVISLVSAEGCTISCASERVQIHVGVESHAT